MRMYDIIQKKKEGGELTAAEIDFFISGYTGGEIPDYQASALLMAICFQGMTQKETLHLTTAMENSGDTVDLSGISGVKVDKHSTGGVGDKTTLIVAPIAAACGVKIAKMSGRGLGHTGGTIDKLESIPGFRTNLSREEFIETVNSVGLAVVGQTGNLCPGDKKLYALRDVTATVDSVPLIASSVMSKKLASGADGILLDVKTGSGAFMKTREDAVSLAREMVNIGKGLGRTTVALVTNMDRPLGRNIGNALEVLEAVEVLQGRGEESLWEICRELSAQMILLGKGADTLEEAYGMAEEAVSSGRAYACLCAMVEAQGGDSKSLPSLGLSPLVEQVKSSKSGYILSLNAQECGIAAMELGAGRETAEDEIDPGAGIVLLKNRGDRVEAGEELALLYTAKPEKIKSAQERFLNALAIGEKPPAEEPLILERITE